MTGSGTSANPYVVTTWGELVQAANAGTYIEFPKEPGTINIEEEYGKNEPPELVIWRGAHINGNGWKIHGLWAKTHSAINMRSPYDNAGAYTLQNLDFSSFHFQNQYFIDSDSYTNIFNISNCTFSGICEGDFINFQSTRPNVSGCTIVIQLCSVGNPSLFRNNYMNTSFSDCIIKVQSSNGVKIFDKKSSVQAKIRSCLFDLSGSVQIFSDTTNTTVSGCIFIGNSLSAINIGNGTPQTVNVFDEEAFPNAVGSTKFVGVPHDKIGDAAYLSSLGLPIGG